VGFALFRLLDITKPWPANWIDRRMSGAAWVLLDDVVAGIYAGALALLLLRWL
jgi:phosphatidylglycerophosphatase A